MMKASPGSSPHSTEWCNHAKALAPPLDRHPSFGPGFDSTRQRPNVFEAGAVEVHRGGSGGRLVWALLANVNPTFNWVRLAQRVPVRIALDANDRNKLVAGATATVEVLEASDNLGGL